MKLSVAMITYNHERFIAQAIDSVLMQRVDFDYEIVVGEDCSTDATREIVAEYQRKNPNRIRLLTQAVNIGANRNFSQTLHACRGEYVALLEGDDYWTSPHKLQKQVDFLDHNLDFAICFHDVVVVDELLGQSDRNYCDTNVKEISTLQDILFRNFIPTLSALFRRKFFDGFPDWVYQLRMGDWPLHTLVAQNGKIKYLNEVMGAYRVQPGGVWSTFSDVQRIQEDIKYLELINRHFGFKYDELIRGRIARAYFNISVIYEELGDMVNARNYARRSIHALSVDRYASNRVFFLRWFRLYYPTAHNIIKRLHSSYTG